MERREYERMADRVRRLVALANRTSMQCLNTVQFGTSVDTKIEVPPYICDSIAHRYANASNLVHRESKLCSNV